MVGVFAKSQSGRASARRLKRFLEDRVGIKRISPAATLQNEMLLNSFEAAEVLEEPFELDHPVDCPSPEYSIMEDGILWRARILERATQKLHPVCVEGTRVCFPWRERSKQTNLQSLVGEFSIRST